MHIRRAAKVPLAATGILAIVVGCGSGTTTAPDASGAASDASGAAPGTPSGEAVTLKFWAYEGQTDWLPVLEKAFEESHPNIQIEITNIPESDYGTKLQTAVAAGSPPDIAFSSRELVKAGKIVPLDEALAGENIDTSTWNQRAVDTCTYEGKLYCVGSYTGAVTLFYNTDMLDAKGIPYPSATEPMTIDEYAAMAEKLTDKANNVYGTTHGDPVTWLARWDLFTDDGRSVQGKINNPDIVHFYDVVAKMMQDGVSPSLNVLDPWEQGSDWFSQKQVAMVITDFQSLFKMEEAGVNWSVAPVPRPTKDYKPEVQAWTDALSVFTDSAHIPEALEFVKFEATEGQKLRMETMGDFPLDSEYAIEANWAGDSPGRKAFLEIFKLSGPDIFVPDMWSSVYSSLFDGFGAVADGSKSAADMLAETEPIVQQDLDAAWKAWDSQ